MTTPATVLVSRLHPKAIIPEYGTTESAGFDLASCEDVHVLPGEIVAVRTGLVLKVDAGLYLQIYNRSSTPRKWGLVLANGVGVVDPDYCGPNDEIKLLYRNVTDKHVVVKAGTRLAQGVLAPLIRANFLETGNLPQQSRGGFGSTG